VPFTPSPLVTLLHWKKKKKIAPPNNRNELPVTHLPTLSPSFPPPPDFGQYEDAPPEADDLINKFLAYSTPVPALAPFQEGSTYKGVDIRGSYNNLFLTQAMNLDDDFEDMSEDDDYSDFGDDGGDNEPPGKSN